ncbi:transposable element Tcb2 transposase [Trichonephila clavipes]|nr:transposable element Tcb2 transposase [Trichonephila clavipes]
MNWPAYSLDFNPIEHVWDMLGRRIAARQPPLTCIPELRRALLDEWCNIPQDQIDNLILSMPKRCAWLRDIWDRGAFMCAALDAHSSTPPFGVGPRTRKLNCSGMEPGRL